MLDSIYHMTLKLLKMHFSVKTLGFCNIFATLLWASFHNVAKICKPLVVY